jgi:DNA-binding FadR family transcriptional regulator
VAQTVVEEMVEAIAGDIFRGRYAPGARLPPYRRIADDFDVTLPTAQRAVGRIQELGLVDVRQGRGATVLDPVTHAHPGVLPYWVSAVLDTPESAREIVEDFLDVRRELASMMLARMSGMTDELDPIEEAVDAMQRLVATEATVEEIRQADMEIVRSMLAVQSSIALATIFNAFSSLMRVVPELPRAMYANPALNVAGYRGALQMIRSGMSATELRENVETTLRTLDRTTADLFERELRER